MFSQFLLFCFWMKNAFQRTLNDSRGRSDDSNIPNKRVENMFLFDRIMNDRETYASDGACQFFFVEERFYQISSDVVSLKRLNIMGMFDRIEFKFISGCDRPIVDNLNCKTYVLKKYEAL